MKDWQALKARYQRDGVAVQIGGLASNLTRIAWCAGQNDRAAALPLLTESKYFTEWAATQGSPEQQALLADVQVELARWEHSWGARLSPATITEQATQWSAKLLESSGLLDG